MRICLISREYPPETGWGGIATFAYHLAHGLLELGHEVEVVSLTDNMPFSSEVEGVTVHRVSHQPVKQTLCAMSICMPYSLYALSTSMVLWEKFFQLHDHKPFDVLDAPELLAEGFFPAVARALPLLIRLYTPHSKFIAERFHNVRPSFDHQCVAALERLAMLNADILTSPSEDLREFVASDLNCPINKIKVVHNPIDVDVFCPSGPKAIQDFGKQIVLFAGRLEERKGINYLVEAIPEVLRSCPNTSFVILGDDTNNTAKGTSVLRELQRFLKASGYLKAVTFIDRVPLPDLACYYRSADVCVIPSVYDNSPYTCLEAMSCGRAAVATSAGGAKEYMVDGESGVIVPPRDSQAIAMALIELLENKSARDELGMNARNRVLRLFQRKEIARKTAVLYKEARANFVNRKTPGLYSNDPARLFEEANAFAHSYDKMIYDLLYAMSWKFRFQHWERLLKARPRLMLAKLLLKVIRPFLFLTRQQPRWLAGKISSLQEQVHLKQQPAPTSSGTRFD